MNITKIIARAEYSPFYRWLLNVGLNRMIPFNKPHGFQVISISRYSLLTKIPYKRRNFNHIRGLHACALATLSEFTTGFLLVSILDPSKYRLIMKTLEMEYHYQGKMDAMAEFTISEEWLEEKIYTPLKNEEAIMVVCKVKIHDIQDNLLSTGLVHWQVKSWEKVRTKVG
jgi:acyl-coenzyme A thioesterase PaaI-like protein